MLPIGHTGPVNSAEFSPDGKKILTASDDKTAKIWDAQTGILIANLKGHKDIVNMAHFSPDGQKIVTASQDNTAKIWDANTGQLVYTLLGHTFLVNSAIFSFDGKKILTASADSSAKIWDANTGRLLADLRGHKGVLFNAQFSPDARQVTTVSEDSTARIWDATSGKLIKVLRGHTDEVNAVCYSQDGKKIVTGSDDKTARIWDANTGILLAELKGHTDVIKTVQFNPDGTKIATASEDSTAKIWDAGTGRLIKSLTGLDGIVNSADFSPDGKILVTTHDQLAIVWDVASGKSLGEFEIDNTVNAAKFNASGTMIVTASADKTADIWNADTRDFIMDLDGHTSSTLSNHFSPDGSRIITSNEDGVTRIWDAHTGQLLKNLIGSYCNVYSAEYSADGKKIVTAADDSTTKIWDANTGQLLKIIKGHKGAVNYAQFSTNGMMIATASADSTARIWDANTGKLITDLKKQTNNVLFARFNPNNTSVVTLNDDGKAKIWDVNTGRLIADLAGHKNAINSVFFSLDGKKIVTASADFTARIWDAATGRLLTNLNGHTNAVIFAQFSHDGQKVVTTSVDNTAKIWDANTGRLLADCKGHTDEVIFAEFSPDGQTVVTSSWDNTAKIWDAGNGKLVADLIGHTFDVSSAQFSPDGGYILTSSDDNTLKQWNGRTGELLYTFFAIDNTDYLVLDKYERFDGTPAARKLLYFTCGTEVIELEQFEDLSWEPGLVGKIMGTNKEPITAKKLAEIQICNYTPDVVQNGFTNGAYQFTIIPRRGGVGEMQLYVNGKLIKNYQPASLPRTDKGYYQLSVTRQLVQPYFITGRKNEVLVKATTAEGSMTSRGITVSTAVEGKKNANPNMYIVSIGINKYKGENIKLNYASTDAESFASAITGSAKKLLNTDGKEHVNAYTFSTETNNPNWPGKVAIQKKLEDIAQMATAEDILVIFFAGHGVMQSGQKSFYLLTAEATGFEMNGVEKDVAISTDELNTWMQNIKANKQLLILDACNSGQAVENLQNLVIKRDVPADQVRALENLKDRNGTFILSASASGQSAYETSQFGQGLLTYSLLSGIKNQDGLTENKYIDVTRWFNTASDNVKALAKEIGGRQEPQIIGNASFDVGLVDAEVMNGIKLSMRKKVFARSVFYTGDPTLLIDNLQLANEIDKELNNQSAMGKASPLTYIESNTSSDAYSIHGSYEINGNTITVRVSLVQQNKKVGAFETTGSVDSKGDLAKKIVQGVTGILNSK